MLPIAPGCKVQLTGLKGRADLNGKEGRAKEFVEESGRWVVELLADKEKIKVKPENLLFVDPFKDDTADTDSGVFVKLQLGGQEIAVEPGKLKKMFEGVVRKYKLMEGDKSDEIADFLTSGDTQSVTAEQFAKKYDMELQDAGVFLAWINVGVSFKEQAIDPHAQEAAKIGKR